MAGTVLLPLSNGMSAIVDQAALDLEFHCEFKSGARWRGQLPTKWSVDVKSSGVYPVRNFLGRKLYLHRVLMNATAADVIDHINGDTLDNRLCNLRIALPGQNQRNCRKPAGAMSPFKGVQPTPGGKFRAQIAIRRTFDLGTFETAELAAAAYDRAAAELFGEFARLNSRS